jgi:hypothetical protein
MSCALVLYAEKVWKDERTLVATAPIAEGTEVYTVPRTAEHTRSSLYYSIM